MPEADLGVSSAAGSLARFRGRDATSPMATRPTVAGSRSQSVPGARSEFDIPLWTKGAWVNLPLALKVARLVKLARPASTLELNARAAART